MNWIKASYYVCLGFLVYLTICVIISIVPIFLNVIGLGASNGEILRLQRYYYFAGSMRSIIQGDAGCVVPDERLGYKPKDGNCIFENFEFKTLLKYEDGSAVMSEVSSTKSKVIVVGDSHAMGWGVSYNETFSYLLSESGYDVTNLAMSSYGTEQQLVSALNSDDFDGAETIIIQYCDNDLGKNKKNLREYVGDEYEYYLDSGRVNYGLLHKLASASKFYLKKFSFFDVLVLPVKALREEVLGSPPSVAVEAFEHKGFLKKILRKYPVFNGKKIIVFYSNGHGAKFSSWEESYGDVHFVDLNLVGDDYYIIDDHLTAPGHKKVARELKRIL